MEEMRSPRQVLVAPFAAVSLAGSLSLFLGAALCDIAYASTYEIQWNNFAAWLLAGALVFAGIALAFALRDALSTRRRTRPALIYAAVLTLSWLIGFNASLVHARDAWASMPGGMVQSCLAFLLAAVATWMAFRRDSLGARA